MVVTFNGQVRGPPKGRAGWGCVDSILPIHRAILFGSSLQAQKRVRDARARIGESWIDGKSEVLIKSSDVAMAGNRDAAFVSE